MITKQLMSPPSYDRAELVELLSATLGQEAASRLVAQALQALQLSGPVLSYDHALDALEHLAGRPGLPGITARLAKSRLRAQRVALRETRG